MGFDDVLGNSRVRKVLRLALQKGRVPNSLLFTGPEGVGKKSLALVLAKAINCLKRHDDACDECAACRAIEAGRFPDVQEIKPEGQIIKVERVREMRQLAYLRPMAGEKRVFIITEAEKLSDASANTLLKILEEPPFFSQFILITHNPDLILSTIKSRCQILPFVPISKAEIAGALEEKGYPEDRARIIALYVGGNFGEALDLEWEEIQEKRREAWTIFRSFLKNEEPASFLRNYGFVRRSIVRDDLEKTLKIMASFCRDLILVKEKGDPGLLLNPDFAGDIRTLENGWSLEQCWRCLGRIDAAISGLNRYMNMSLIISAFYSLLGEDTYDRDRLSRF
ncbi:MAG: DNA polymerase III subunit delta' [Candidatus Aminicenantes bacterium]|nr:DNA polymerase III subunit delta' [Candidatus Aminicenantes bacterium]